MISVVIYNLINWHIQVLFFMRGRQTVGAVMWEIGLSRGWVRIFF